MVSIHVALSTQTSMGFGLQEEKNASLSNKFKGTQLAILICACMSFIVSATALTLVKPDSKIGAILVQRIMKTQHNWTDETLRSFSELWLWMCVNWCTYGVTGSVTISVACGTLAG
jgi:hypothetical protein